MSQRHKTRLRISGFHELRRLRNVFTDHQLVAELFA